MQVQGIRSKNVKQLNPIIQMMRHHVHCLAPKQPFQTRAERLQYLSTYANHNYFVVVYTAE